MNAGLTIIQHQVLTSLAEGYAARLGMKDRIRALNEWEIARRGGLTEASYAEYLTHPTREEIGAALSALQRAGLVAVWDRGAKYDTYVPTPAGTELVAGAFQASESLATNGTAIDERHEPAVMGAPAAPPMAGMDHPTNEDRLDEIIRLLRSIDAKLGGR